MKKHLKGHALAHTGQYQCIRGCKNLAFKTLPELDVHIKKKHEDSPNPDEFNCEMCELVFTAQHYLRKHVNSKHGNITKPNCDNCGLVLQNKEQLKKHIESCYKDNEGGFKEVKSKVCRYFLNGNCWRQEQCRFVHDIEKKTERQGLPPCRNGTHCAYLARGRCKYFHINMGPRSFEPYFSKNRTQNYEEKKSNFRPWCKYQEDCIRTPNCSYKHYDEVFPKLPKTNNPPWHNPQSIWEDY